MNKVGLRTETIGPSSFPAHHDGSENEDEFSDQVESDNKRSRPTQKRKRGKIIRRMLRF